MVDPKIVERIQKLFNLGDKTRNSSEGETMNALEAAQRLMKEHNISMAEVARHTTKEGKNKSWKSAKSVAAGGSGKKQFISIFENTLFAAVAKLTGTQHIRFHGNTMVFFGEEQDVAIAQGLYRVLLESMRRCSRTVIGPGWTPSHRQFAEGFMDEVWRRACEATKPAPVEGGGIYAMVVASKSTWLADQLALAFPKMTRCKAVAPRGKMDPVAYSLGVEDGSKVDLAHKNRLE